MLYETAAGQYYSDQYTLYLKLHYGPSPYQALADKSETYAVEADNAELRHYLARLARRSRCFSRSSRCSSRSSCFAETRLLR